MYIYIHMYISLGRSRHSDRAGLVYAFVEFRRVGRAGEAHRRGRDGPSWLSLFSEVGGKEKGG